MSWLQLKSLAVCGVLFLAACSNGKQSGSRMLATPKDREVAVYKVPRPVDHAVYPRIAGIGDFVPLVISQDEKAQRTIGYWLACADKGEQDAILKALGLNPEDFDAQDPIYNKSSKYPRFEKETERDAYLSLVCNSTDDMDLNICEVLKAAPELQSPVICPSTLPLLGNMKLRMYKAGDEYVAQYAQGLARRKGIELGCRELKDALTPKGNVPYFSEEVTTADSNLVSNRSDLNCFQGTPVVDTFESLCEAGRSGESEGEKFMTEALVKQLGLSPNLACHELKSKISEKLPMNSDQPVKLDLGSEHLTSIRQLAFFPGITELNLSNNDITDLEPLEKLAALRKLDLSNNPRLGAQDSTDRGVLSSLSQLGFLEDLNLLGTRIGSLAALERTKHLLPLAHNWAQTIPSSCPANALSQDLAEMCKKVQSPLALEYNGSAAPEAVRFGPLKTLDFTIKVSHPLALEAPSQALSYALRMDPSSSCQGFVVKGLRVWATSLPENDCELVLTAVSGSLNSRTLRIPLQKIKGCGDEHPVGDEWEDNILHGRATFRCDEWGTEMLVAINSCETGYVKAATECRRVDCGGGHFYPDEWEDLTEDGHGRAKYRCEADGKVVQQGAPIRCDAGYAVKGNSCGLSNAFIAACESGSTADRIDVTVKALVEATSASGTCEEKWQKISGRTELDLLGKGISNLEPLRALTGVTKLRLSYNKIENIEPLRDMVDLRDLDIGINPIRNIEPLRELRKLSVLDLVGNHAIDFKPLPDFKALTSLHVGASNFKDLAVLRQLPNLRELDIGYTRVSDLEPLRHMTELTSLGLSGNGIKNIEPLSGLKNLQYLNIWENKVTDLRPLSGLTSLTNLKFWHAEVKGYNNPVPKNSTFCPTNSASRELNEECREWINSP